MTPGALACCPPPLPLPPAPNALKGPRSLKEKRPRSFHTLWVFLLFELFPISNQLIRGSHWSLAPLFFPRAPQLREAANVSQVPGPAASALGTGSSPGEFPGTKKLQLPCCRTRFSSFPTCLGLKTNPTGRTASTATRQPPGRLPAAPGGSGAGTSCPDTWLGIREPLSPASQGCCNQQAGDKGWVCVAPSASLVPHESLSCPASAQPAALQRETCTQCRGEEGGAAALAGGTGRCLPLPRLAGSRTVVPGPWQHQGLPEAPVTKANLHLCLLGPKVPPPHRTSAKNNSVCYEPPTTTSTRFSCRHDCTSLSPVPPAVAPAARPKLIL